MIMHPDSHNAGLSPTDKSISSKNKNFLQINKKQIQEEREPSPRNNREIPIETSHSIQQIAPKSPNSALHGSLIDKELSKERPIEKINELESSDISYGNPLFEKAQRLNLNFCTKVTGQARIKSRESSVATAKRQQKEKEAPRDYSVHNKNISSRISRRGPSRSKTRINNTVTPNNNNNNNKGKGGSITAISNIGESPITGMRTKLSNSKISSCIHSHPHVQHIVARRLVKVHGGYCLLKTKNEDK